MDIRILGPVEVVVGGRSRRLGSRRERAVLSALALGGGDVISTDQLIEALWGDDPPRSAGKALQNYVLRLRKAIGAEVIETRSPGYGLAANHVVIDSRTFDQLIREGLDARSSGRPEDAAASIRQALHLWRGVPLEELHGWVLADVEAARLTELRRVAAEELMDAEIACGRSAPVVAELEAMVATEPLRERRWAMLMLALYRCGRQADALRAYQRARTLLGEELGIEPGPELQELERAIVAQDPSLDLPMLPAGAPTSECEDTREADDDPTPPYKGLAPYEIEDRAVFFGRGPLVEEIVRRAESCPVVALVGPSGSGKSSVLRAGVAVALTDDARPGPPWETLIMRPAAHPLVELATGLSSRLDRPASEILDRLEVGPHGLDDLAREELPPATRLAILVDQFEELFTQTPEGPERDLFLSVLLDAAARPDPRVSLVLAIRADFYGHCAEHPELARALDSSSLLLGPMEPDDLRAAVTGPAEAAGLRTEPGFVELIVEDVSGRPGSLPLLSHALLETWKRRSHGTLTVTAYREAGGARGAIARTAEAVYRDLDPAEQTLARQVFLRLTDIHEGAPDTARPVSRDELIASADGQATDRVLNRLSAARLITIDDHTVQLAHEAVIAHWPRLQTWLAEDRGGRRIHRHITQAALDWRRLGFEPTELYQGPRLALATEWVEREGGTELNTLEAEFIAASRQREDAIRTAQQEQAEGRERSHRRLRQLLTATAVALVIALLAGAVAVAQRTRADDAASAARSASTNATVDRLVVQSKTLQGENRYLGTLLALEAERMRDDPQTRGALFDSLLQEPRRVATLASSPASDVAPLSDGTALVVAGGRLERWDTHSGEQLPDLPGPGATAVAVGPGEVIAVGRSDGSIALLDRDGQSRGPVIEAVPADGDTPARPVIAVDHGGFGSGPGSLAFSPDGRLLAASFGLAGDPNTIDGTDSVHVYDTATGDALPATYPGHTGTVTAVSFSPDGQTLLTGGNDAHVISYDVTSGRETAPPTTVSGPVWSARYSPVGHRIAVATTSSGAAVIDQDTGTTTEVGQASEADAAWSADGTRLVVGGNGPVEVFDAATLEPVRPPIDAQTGTALPRFLPDGRILVGGRSGPTTVWDLDGQSVLVRPVRGAPAYVFPMAGGDVVAVPDLEDSVTLYDADSLEPLGPPLSPGPAPENPLQYPATFAASYYDGDQIAVVNRAGTLQLYDVASRAPVGPSYALGFPTMYAVFSRDMNTIAIGGRQGEVALVDLPNQNVRVLPSVLNNYVDALAFSPTVTSLAADNGHTVMFGNLDRDTPTVRDLSRFTRPAGAPAGRRPLTGRTHPGHLRRRHGLVHRSGHRAGHRPAGARE